MKKRNYFDGNKKYIIISFVFQIVTIKSLFYDPIALRSFIFCRTRVMEDDKQINFNHLIFQFTQITVLLQHVKNHQKSTRNPCKTRH